MKVKAVIFDLDGTLRDTRELIYGALDHAFVTLGLPSPTRDELAPYIHHHSFVREQFAPQVDLEDFEEIYGAKVEEMLPGIRLYEQAGQVLATLHKKGYKLAIVTAAKTAPQNVHTLKIDKYLDALVSAGDISKHKPDPEGTNLALKRLHVEPQETIMVGDMGTDIQAAQAAHLARTIGITHGLGTKESLLGAGADYIVDSLAGLPSVIEAINTM